jgi:hypothetical protein
MVITNNVIVARRSEANLSFADRLTRSRLNRLVRQALRCRRTFRSEVRLSEAFLAGRAQVAPLLAR